MQYHAFALAVNGVTVDLVGAAGTAPSPAIASHPRIRCHQPAAGRPAAPGRGYTLRALWRVVRQSATAAVVLWRLPPPDLVLLQVPPAMPWGVLAWIVSRIRRARFVIDWHNLGWTLLALRLGERRLVRAVRAVEGWLGRRADAHLCVSRAMREHLAIQPGIGAAVLYDRPPSWFLESAQADHAAWRRRLCALGQVADDAAIVISPTSFTEDEDLGVVGDAAARLSIEPASRTVLFVISGRGPGRDAFVARTAHYAAGAQSEPRVVIVPAWFEPAEYPAALAAADAGLCLHRSSSGLDLPMKIADMFGVGLPVLAVRYDGLAERVRDGENGRLFSDAEGLAQVIRDLWADADTNAGAGTERRRLAAASAAAGADGWLDGWTREAMPTLLGGRP